MKSQEQIPWTVEKILELGRSYQPAAVLLAGAELNIFGALAPRPVTAAETAAALSCDLRGVEMLLDALAALGLVSKNGEQYSLVPGVADALTASNPRNVLAMARHQANCLRNWAQLAMVVKTGVPAPDLPSIGGPAGDLEAFIGAMDNVSEPVADKVIQALAPGAFRRVLDIGGASGTWTMALLRLCPQAEAILLDLPHVIPLARRRLEAAGYASRVALVAGDYNRGPLPAGADLCWISAIVHQNSRAQNRSLLARAFAAMQPGGRVALRDIVMEPGRTRPLAGALFAINMLTATDGGGTFTFDELREDLESAGFVGARLVRSDPAMNSIVVADKPA